MKSLLLGLFFLLISLSGCGGSGNSTIQTDTPAPVDPALPALALQQAFLPLSFRQPVALLPLPGPAGRWYLVEKGGVVFTFAEGNQAATVAADLSAKVNSLFSEAGLLGMSFHPRFASNREVFFSYTAPGSPLLSRISRFSLPAGGTAVDTASEEILLEVPQPFENHNGGHITFGPDGLLYIGLGDGGSGGDPRGNGQDVTTLLGSLLRIDVDTPGVGMPYAIPPGNPFATGGGRPEIFAWGFRNPWRFTFDAESGQIWAGDVGQGNWEEIDRVEIGGNYGWNLREGAHCYPPSELQCQSEGLIDPIAEYSHDAANCSVTGGYVYRGAAIPGLQGTYLFGDFCTGRIWGLPPGPDGVPAGPAQLLFQGALQISSFAEGPDGEIYVLDFVGGGIYRLASG